MIKSQNKNIDLSIKGSFLKGMGSYGDILIGDRAFEYYNEKNVRDYIQIPYDQIRLVTASVYFNKKITRFAIHTKSNGDFVFSSKDNKKVLRALNKYLPDEKLRQSLKVKDYIKNIFKKPPR